MNVWYTFTGGVHAAAMTRRASPPAKLPRVSAMPRVLTDQVIIITGASSGIGAATAIECAKAGMNVVLNARREEKLHAVAEQVRQTGAQAEVVVGDVTDQRTSARMLDAAQQRFGRFDVVFAND